MERSAFAGLFPAGTRFLRCFAAPEAASGGVRFPVWDAPGMELCKARSRGRAVRGGGVFLKEFVYRSFWERLRRRFMPPRPFTALAAARRLAELGVPTPRVLAAARGIAPDGAIHDLLVTEELPREVCFGDAAAKLPGADRFALALELVPTVARLHDGGFCHGDLSLRNWYRTPGGAWGLIDCDGTTLSAAPLSVRRRTEELARLASSCFTAAPDPADDREVLRKFLRGIAAAAEKCGERVCFRRFERRSRFLADRFRVKYIDLEVLK